MASSSGTTMTSSGESGLGSGSGSGLGSYPGRILNSDQDTKKRKRMISNRESARRSRERKQKHLDELTTQLSQLRNTNNEMMTRVSITTQHYMSVESENYVLRVQVEELSRHLQSLNNIIACIYAPAAADGGCGFPAVDYGGACTELVDELLGNSVSYGCGNYQPILASADMFMY